MMKRIAHGIDLVDCERIEKLLQRHETQFLERVFTARELSQAPKGKRRAERLAGRFAVKEALMKLIGTGWRDGVAWTDIEVVNDALGRPQANLSGRVLEIANTMGIQQISVSITHTANLAIASAVALADNDEKNTL
jgi:holo-[acyl-carrier protein] synthase